MISKTTVSLAFGAACLTLAAVPAAHAQYYYNQPQVIVPQVETNGPQASRGDFGDWSARRNVIESAHYDRLLQTNMGFRHARMRKRHTHSAAHQLTADRRVLRLDRELAFDARTHEHLVHLRARAVAMTQRNKRLALQIGRLDDGLRSQPMAHRHAQAASAHLEEGVLRRRSGLG